MACTPAVLGVCGGKVGIPVRFSAGGSSLQPAGVGPVMDDCKLGANKFDCAVPATSDPRPNIAEVAALPEQLRYGLS